MSAPQFPNLSLHKPMDFLCEVMSRTIWIINVVIFKGARVTGWTPFSMNCLEWDDKDLFNNIYLLSGNFVTEEPTFACLTVCIYESMWPHPPLPKRNPRYAAFKAKLAIVRHTWNHTDWVWCASYYNRCLWCAIERKVHVIEPQQSNFWLKQTEPS